MKWREGEGLPENLKGLLEILEWWHFRKERVDKTSPPAICQSSSGSVEQVEMHFSMRGQLMGFRRD